MTLIDKFLFLIVHSIDKLGIWPHLPVFLGLFYLGTRRHLHQEYNLFNVGRTPVGVRFNPADFPYRTADGKYNDPFNEASEATFFGRNILPVDQENKLLKPDPMVVATKLLARRSFVDTGKQFNMIAASWRQFMIHDWVDHLEATNQGLELAWKLRFRRIELECDSLTLVELTAPREVASHCPLAAFKFYKTKEVPTNFYEIKSGYLNIRTPWWDGSALYGSTAEILQKVRTFKDGKLKISKDGLLLHDENGNALTGDARSSWAGISTLQALFVKEHNAVCDALKKEYQDLGDEELYRHARLVTSAVIAKIHTIDWMVELLKTATLLSGMRANWYGLLGKKFKDTFGHVGGGVLLSGLVGLKKPENHGVPYSLTEEFVGVYRMHSLMPDHLHLRDITAAPGPNKVPMQSLIGHNGENSLSEIGFERQMVSMGHQACGALQLWNYPVWMRDLVAQNVDGTDRPNHVDMPALEVYRDRERKVARYNQFRRALLLIPISKWEDLTDDKEAIKVLKEVYGDDIEQLDLLVGLMAEKKIKGFAISETAFIIFLVMATRRLEADRFCTSNFNEETYTKKGFHWVNTTESLKDVLDRHYPKMTEKWMNSTSAFSVWDSPPNAHLIPMSQGYAIELYFDPALENQVLKAWNVLARRQISTQLIEIESRPHITLFSSPGVEPTRLESIIKSFASKQEPLLLSLSTIGSFCNDNNVLFLAPTPSVSLLQFQSQLCEAIKKEGIDLGDEYRAENWIPYCSVAQEVPKTRMAEAFCVLRELKLPVSGYAMDIGLVEYSPVRELFSFGLGNTVEA
ncbi:hypothetical protein Pint_02653 [Pistacia integerrima]|uniref:Uncharacterized protein n=1 Tax=Pistacia integerrima TaxID=434235 RepID=A0ACC0ZK37_9ROSI|nr:hypothetical protein Pint_02653 [Pistacia integerrima]